VETRFTPLKAVEGGKARPAIRVWRKIRDVTNLLAAG